MNIKKTAWKITKKIFFFVTYPFNGVVLERLDRIEKKVDRIDRRSERSEGTLNVINEILCGGLSKDDLHKAGISLERIWYSLNRMETVLLGDLSDEQISTNAMSYEKLIADIETIKPKVNYLADLSRAITNDDFERFQEIMIANINGIERSDHDVMRAHSKDSRANFHLDRYTFAEDYVHGLSCLDIACGTGYGSEMLAKKAKSVLGVDIAKEAIDFAKKHYESNILKFKQGIIEELKTNQKFEVIVSFETIEHVDEPKVFAQHLHKHLNENGTLIISAPNNWQDLDVNKAHKHNIDVDMFCSILEEKFDSITYYRQNSGSPRRPENQKMGREICRVSSKDELELGECLMAVCQKQSLEGDL